ncbi:MAG TPA: outer membrane beta-barrel protein [Candidatus Angelobacter sp.]|nr:outer membrane beta-barrel protein [Candidatus Angelobacter sp.]
MSLDRKFLSLIFAIAVTCDLGSVPMTAQENPPSNPELQQLREMVSRLQARVDQLERSQATGNQATVVPAIFASPGGPAAASGDSAPAQTATLSKEDRSVLDFFRETTINGALDGYYEYNFNHPIGRVNLLRAYDVSSNSFSINQANLIVERAPDVDSGHRLGVRLDFQYGQATETLQGSAANELRPQVYRPLFQAYGTYVFPVGTGLTVDFGKWASALGFENNYSKDQINYSRSYYFNFLPFYHTGFRAAYNLTPKINLAYWLVNGVQQTEDFNGFKSQAFIFTIKPVNTVSWNVNYYFGQEQPDVVPALNPGLPVGPTQPGLPTVNITPVPNGREHILDSYVSWNANSKLTLGAEVDYVINRVFSISAPSHVTGGAGYVRYQLTPRWAAATRAEYLSDRGGLFSGRTQALKENTVTLETKVAEGLLMRSEWRVDYSNQPFFLTDTAAKRSHQQNTASLGLIWWFGRKQGTW